MTLSNADNKFESQAQALGFDFNGEIKIGGNYAPVIQHGHVVYVSGQIPRVGDRVVVTGTAGQGVTLEQAQIAAQICVIRALALLRNQLGSLSKIKQVLRITVYVNSAHNFTQQSEVADGASDILFRVLGEAGRHTRTSVGVAQLPKGATVELDLIAAI
jgi:enamine deaminase RidA (YjgF/YER057c/UK114 family)